MDKVAAVGVAGHVGDEALGPDAPLAPFRHAGDQLPEALDDVVVGPADVAVGVVDVRVRGGGRHALVAGEDVHRAGVLGALGKDADVVPENPALAASTPRAPRSALDDVFRRTVSPYSRARASILAWDSCTLHRPAS